MAASFISSALATAGFTATVSQQVPGYLKPEVFSSRISPAAYTIDLKKPDA